MHRPEQLAEFVQEHDSDCLLRHWQETGPAVKMEEVAWAGRFPIVRGGVATFTLQPQAPFMISVRAEATMSPRGESALWQAPSTVSETLHKPG